MLFSWLFILELLFPYHVTMGDHFAACYFVWSESSGSNVSTGSFVEESDSKSHANEDGETPFMRHGPFWRQILKILSCNAIFGVIVQLASYFTIGSFQSRICSSLSTVHGESEV